MELKHFFLEVKNYWGPYENQGTAKRTWEYVAKKVPKKALPQLLARLMQDVSTQYRHVPDIHDIHVAYRNLVNECALLPAGGSDVRKIEYNMENHRDEVLACFAELKSKLGWE